MSRLEFEKQFERKLKNREISPSAESWEKLQNKLDKNSSPKYPFWMGIAATIIGGILIVSLVFNQNDLPEPVKVVENPLEEAFEEKIAPPTQKEVQIVQNEPKNMQKEQKSVRNQEKSIISEPFQEEKIKVAENDISEPLLLEKRSEFFTFSAPEEIKLQQKLEEVLAKVTSEEMQNGTVSESEIDDLLAQAALELSLENDNSAYAEKLAADDLLYDVEMELEQSFRAKVFEALKEGFEKTRTAVANRY